MLSVNTTVINGIHILTCQLQGKADNFLSAGQLLPDKFVAACAEAKVPVVLRMQEVFIYIYIYI